MSKNIIASAAIGLSLFALGVVGSKAQGSNSTLTKELILKTGTYNSLLKTGSQTSNYTYTLPITTPTTNQVLTATAVSGTDVTLGWSSAGGGGGVTYGPGSTQATLNDRTVRLFDVSYQSGAGAAVGARIQSGSTDLAATGLTVSAIGNTNANGLVVSATGTATNTAVGASFAATGGTNNYALVVPASSGNVGIGNAAPGSLLSVGSSGQLTVNTSGNLATSGTVVVTGGSLSLGSAATAPELRFYEPSGSGTNYSSVKAGIQGSDINYTLPTTQPGAAGRTLVVSSVTGAGPYDVALDWSSASPGTGNSTMNMVRISTNQAIANGAYTDVTGWSFSVSANTNYSFEIMLIVSQAANNDDMEIRFVGPTGTTNTYGIVPLAANSASNVAALNEAESTTRSIQNAGTNANSQWLITGMATVAGTAGTWKIQMHPKTGSATITVKAGSYMKFTN